MASIAGMSIAIVVMFFCTFLANRYRNTKYQTSNFKQQIGFANVRKCHLAVPFAVATDLERMALICLASSISGWSSRLGMDFPTMRSQ
jgi:hypothetical protein